MTDVDDPLLNLRLTGPLMPELGGVILDRLDELEQQYVGIIREAIPRAALLDDLAVADDFLPVIRAGANAMTDPTTLGEVYRMSPTHGVARAAQGYNFAELVRDNWERNTLLTTAIHNALGSAMSNDHFVRLHQVLRVMDGRNMMAFSRHREAGFRLAADARAEHLAMMSHDLRNGLNGVLLSLSMIRDGLGDAAASTVREDLTGAEQMIRGTVDVMERLLAGERERAAEVKLKIDNVPLRQLLQGVVRSSRRTADAGAATGIQPTPKTDSVEIDCPDDLTIRSDFELLSTILLNVLGNAFRYAGDGLIRIGVDTSDGTRITVADAGPGIPPEALPTLFDRYRRGKANPTDGGSGLGLYICHRATHALGGEITAHNAAEGGAVFTIHLPDANAS
jgi:signal transduction histidine kinase